MHVVFLEGVDEMYGKVCPGLAFIAYPKAMAAMPMAPLWSALFFCMILMVGLDSQFVQVESVVTAVVDLFPNQLRVGYRREMLVGVVCLVDMVIGCTMVMQVSGEEW
ncbi:Sodium- and chloride-dependent GABA transporter 3 [Portunus trituberculatus]|uniref:Sodium-and chloride-dependent GABA transporter 3 n=1 Tax=Portunus trituberculatus TaxID=210409 RepID=A0A5B7IWE0_PORTR|nr:Sodium- and chloride-dependent GABA transporter 3 [Portunus trituberculatus]